MYLIVDLSASEGFSVNDNIDETLCSLSYISVEDEVQAKGSSYLAKVVIQSTYRTIPVHPEDWNLLGMVWENSLFIDTALSFWLKLVPQFSQWWQMWLSG